MFFGELAVSTSNPRRRATVKALSDLTLLKIPKKFYTQSNLPKIIDEFYQLGNYFNSIMRPGLIASLGFDTLWFGILFVVNMEMAFLTPPFGINLFYMKGVAPEGTTMGDIYRAIVPFVILQAIGLVIVILFPPLALWLPSLMFS